MVGDVGQISSLLNGVNFSATKNRHEEMFAKIDTNGDGYINKAELTAFGQQFSGKTSEFANPEEMFSKIDTNSDGRIDKAEMKAFGQQHHGKGHKPGNPDEIFSKIDTNGDGYVSKDELTAFGQQFRNKVSAPENSDEIFSKMDSDGDGKISKTEFTDFHKKMEEQMRSEMMEQLGSNNTTANSSVMTLLDSLNQGDKDNQKSANSATWQYGQNAQINAGSILNLLG